jgi:signal transduction histidine kinase
MRSSDHEQVIAYEIHDGLAQQLAGALLQFQSYEYQKDHHAERAREDFEAGLTALRQAHFEARRLIAACGPRSWTNMESTRPWPIWSMRKH